jgi:hypothetical protein
MTFRGNIMNLFPVNRQTPIVTPVVTKPVLQPITYAYVSPPQIPSPPPIIIKLHQSVPMSAAAIPLPATVSKFDDWDGAGTIIIEKDYHNSRGTINTIILYQDRKGNYTIPFGRRDARHKSPEHTANAETAEESCNLFRFGKDQLQRQYALTNGKNIAFPICINGSATIRRNTYHSNHALLHSRPTCPRGYKETISMTRVSISEIIRSGFSQNLTDVDGQMITIEDRSMGFIKQMIRNGYHTILLSQPITLVTKRDESSSFLGGTIYHH